MDEPWVDFRRWQLRGVKVPGVKSHFPGREVQQQDFFASSSRDREESYVINPEATKGHGATGQI